MIIGIDASRALRATQTGTERYALEIIRHLLALPAASNYQWRLYVDAIVPQQYFADAASVAQVEHVVLPRQRLWTHRALAGELLQRPPHLLFVPAHVIPFGRWRLLPNERRPRSIVTIHDLGYHYFPQAHSFFQRAYLPVSTHWSTAVADSVIAVSHATASDLQRIYHTVSEKIAVVHEAPTARRTDVDTTINRVGTLQIPTDAICARFQLPPFYGLYVGTLQPRKNLTRLIQAYATAHQRGAIEWPLILVGAAGYQAEELQTLVQAYQLEDHVRFLGYVDDAERAALYRGASLFLFPSLFEGFGLPVLEAQSYGVPVMCANNSSLPEIAGDAAILVDPTDVDAIADAMVQLSKDEELRQRLIAAGHENVKRFSWEKAARETFAVFEKVLGRQK